MAGPRQAEESPVKIKLLDDGRIEVVHPETDETVAEHVRRKALTQAGPTIQSWLAQCCEQMNSELNDCLEIHRKTPAPEPQVQFPKGAFTEDPIEQPIPRPLGLLGRLFRSRRMRIESENAAVSELYAAEVEKQNARRLEFERREEHRRLIFEELRYSDVDEMDGYLEYVLSGLGWPRETAISFELYDHGRTVFLDVDLPEVEDMPAKAATVAGRGLKLNVKWLSEAQTRKNYARHIHGVGFRAIGVSFHSLPVLQEVVFSGYSQRPDKVTGHVTDDYLYSVKVRREDWESINFDRLESVDAIEALGAFEIRRQMTATGIFRPIEPFAA